MEYRKPWRWLAAQSRRLAENVLAGLLPRGPAETFARLRPYGFIVLYALMISGALSAMIGPPADLFMRLLLQ